MPTNNRTRPALTQRTRDVIFAAFGPCCGICGERIEPGEPWEVNHVFGRDWTPNKVSSYGRNRRYLAEAKRGLVNVSHKACNGGHRPRPAAEAPPEGHVAPEWAKWQAEATPF